MNHLSYFGIREDPFRLTPDSDFYFQCRPHNQVAEVVRYGLQQGEGFLLVSGEVGTGKTMLLRQLRPFFQQNYEVAYIISPQLSPQELLLAILQDLDILGEQALAPSPIMFQRLSNHLVELDSQGKRLLLVIDEAQNLPEESIEQLRLLSNFETDKRKLLQILLVGQPELRSKINQPSLRQLRQRITIAEQLSPLSRQECQAYINYRLSRVERTDMLPRGNAGKLLYRYSGGIPRLINKLMGRCLLMAYAAQQQYIDKKVVKEAAKSLEMEPRLDWWGRVRPGSH